MMQISKTIARLRSDHKLSMSQMAAKLGVDKSYISKLESGKIEYPPSDRFLSVLAKKFDLDKERLSLECGRLPLEMQRAIASSILTKMDAEKRSQ